MTQPPPKENDVMNPVQQNNETISEENFALAVCRQVNKMCLHSFHQRKIHCFLSYFSVSDSTIDTKHGIL
jgi:hypothetical protein